VAFARLHEIVTTKFTNSARTLTTSDIRNWRRPLRIGKYVTRDGVNVRWRNWRRWQAFWMSLMSSQSAGLIIILKRRGVRHYLGGTRITDQPPAAIIFIFFERDETRNPHPIRRVYHPGNHCEHSARAKWQGHPSR
jgi:hypothetical protein